MEPNLHPPHNEMSPQSRREDRVVAPISIGPEIISPEGKDHSIALERALNRGNVVEPIAIDRDDESGIIRWKIKVDDTTVHTAISLLAANTTKPVGTPKDTAEAPNTSIGLPVAAVDVIMKAHANLKTKPKLRLTPFNPKRDETGKVISFTYYQAEFLDTTVTTEITDERTRVERVTSVTIGNGKPIPVIDKKINFDFTD